MSVRNSQRVTVRDVAAACGLALSTVSNALANKSIVKPETRMHVRHVAEQLGYRASTVARELRTGKSWSIAMVISDITNPFHGEVVRGVESVLLDQGYHLFIANTDGSSRKQAHCVDLFEGRQVDGMIVQSYNGHREDASSLVSSHIPTVLLISKLEEASGLDFAGIENSQSTRAALLHLWSLGHRRIGFIAGPKRASGAGERLTAYRDFMTEMQGAWDERMVDYGEYTIDSGRNAAARLLSRSKPTALMVSEDMMALGAMSATTEMGLQVPRDVSIIGWADIFAAALPQINLTTLHVPKRQLGGEAARLLTRRIAEPEAEIETRLVKPQLIVRGTTGPNLCG